MIDTKRLILRVPTPIDRAPLHAMWADPRVMADLGVVGVRFTWRRLAALPDLGVEPYRCFLRRLANCGMHVELLAGSASLPTLLPALTAAGVAVVVDHFGVPSRDADERHAGTLALLRAVDKGGTWVKLSAGFRMPFEIAAEVTQALLDHVGAARLLWGSDAPYVNHEAGVDYAATLSLYRRLVPNATMRAEMDRAALALYFNEGKR